MVVKLEKARPAIALVLILLLLLGGPGALLGRAAYVSPGGSMQWFPAIFGQRVVWSDNRSGSMDIYLYDFATNRELPISTAYSDQYMPKIYGDRVVWMDKRNMVDKTEKWDIYMYDLVTSQETPICTSPGSHKLPSIWGDRIVWQDERNGNSDIYLYDLATKTERSVSLAKGPQMYPVIDGDRIAWLDARENTNFTDIYYYDLDLEREFPVWVHNPNRPEAAGPPAIFGDSIVWDINHEDGSSSLYLYRIPTGATSTLVTEGGSRENRTSIYRVAIFGNWVAYTLYKNSIRQIKVFDLNSGQDFVPSPSQLGQDAPALWGDTLVFLDKSGVLDKIAFTQLTSTRAPVAPYFDIEEHWSRPWVEALSSRGLVHGFEDGTFRPDSKLTRAQFAQLLANAFTPANGELRQFPDVPSTAWYAPAVEVATRSGWLIGFEDGTFRPNDTLTKAQALTALVRVSGLPQKEGNVQFPDVIGHWAEKSINSFFLAQPSLLDSIYYRYIAPRDRLEPDSMITRGQTAMLEASVLRLALTP